MGLDWTYSQGTHTLTDSSGTVVSTGGYAGNGAGLNNPAMQNVQNIGPLPQGTYTIGPQYKNPNTGVATMNLTPAATNNMFGRSLFRIHGDNAAQNNSASEGCIIQNRNVRDQIYNSGDTTLIVVP